MKAKLSKIEADSMYPKKAWNMGAEAYRKGKTENDNPFLETHTLYDEWLIGFRVEKKYWEKQ